MEGEGLVLALIAVREARCHRHRASCHFVVSSLSLCLRMALSSCPRSMFSLLSRCLCRGVLLAHRRGVSLFCSRLVIVLRCVVFCALVPSFDGQVTRGVSEVCWDEYGMDSPNQTTYNDQCRRSLFG